MLKRVLLLVIVLTAVTGVGLVWRPAIAPVTPPGADQFPAAMVAAGKTMAAAGNCEGCHTTASGMAWGGGLSLATDFGLVYSANISPDPETGIGNWSQEAFARALSEGVSRDGTHLFPAFPYTHFTRLGDDDVQALYAFVMTRTPVVARAPSNTLTFPFNVRALQAGWKLLFFERGVYQEVSGKSESWNRGAYLADGITHCAACHTPRNRLGAERKAAAYEGAKVDGWLAPPLNAANPAPLPWSQQDLFDYLRTGESEGHGAAAGVMADVVHKGLAGLPDTDVRALSDYFASLNGSADRQAATGPALTAAAARRLVDVGKETEPGANLYLAACAYCHYSGAPSAPAVHGSLALSTALTSDDPSNFLHTVMQGVGGSAAGADGSAQKRPYMPGFAASLTDADIASLGEYLRRTRTDQKAWTGLPAAVAAVRSDLDHLSVQHKASP